MRPENMKSKPLQNSSLNRLEIFIQERISGNAKNLFKLLFILFNTGQQQRSQNQDESHQTRKRKGTELDKIPAKEIIFNEVDTSNEKSDKNEEQVQQLLTSWLVESPPDKVSWHKMAMALNMKWTSVCKTHRGLTEDNMFYLATKAFRNPSLHRDNFKNLVISWSQFCKEPLPDRNFTFWEWFHRIMTLTSIHLQGPWTEGYIMGFVSKMEVEQILTNMDNGTFILRFSDSELGGVSIAYVKQDPYSGQKQVTMVAPFTNEDLTQRSIADIVFDLEKNPNNEQNLTCVYSKPMPVPLEGFRKFTSSSCQQRSTPTGYVPHALKTKFIVPKSFSPNQDGDYKFVASTHSQDGSNIGFYSTNFYELDNSVDQNIFF